MIVNTRRDLFLFVEDEQPEDQAQGLRPSTLLGWEVGDEGEVYPVTPMTGVVCCCPWGVYDLFLQQAYGIGHEDSRVTPERITQWVSDHIDASARCENVERYGRETLQ